MIIGDQEIDEAWLNKNFAVQFTPIREKVKPILLTNRRQTISFSKLHELIGKQRSEFIIKKCLVMKEQKKTFNVQNRGRVSVFCV